MEHIEESRAFIPIIAALSVLIGLVAGIVIGMGLATRPALTLSAAATTPNGLVVAIETDRPPTRTRAPIPPPAWHEVTRFEGKGVKETEAFAIQGREWRISWDTGVNKTFNSGILQITAYDADSGAMKTLAANVMAPDTDSTIMRGAGSYYLSINAMQPYTITVEDRY